MQMKQTDLLACSILIVDDHPLLREGLRRTLTDAGVKNLREATDGFQALSIVETFRPDIILMDLYMPGMSGIEATGLMLEKVPAARIVILTVCEDDASVADALMAGAQGYLNKSMHSHEIINSLRQLIAGKIPLSKPMNMAILGRLTDTPAGKAVGKKLKQHQAAPVPGNPISAREKEVLSALAVGLSNREIAQKLYISENTVKNHVRNILEKMEVNSRTQAIAKALADGLIHQHPLALAQKGLR